MVSWHRGMAWAVCILLVCAGCGGDDETPPPPECPGSYSLTLLPLPNATSSSSAKSVNAGGEAVGEISGDAARWSGGSFSAIVNTLGGFNSLATGINDARQIVGGAETATATIFHPFLFANGTLTDLGTLGGSSGFAQAISNAGDIVGQAQTAGNVTTHAFVIRSGGTMQDLGTLGGSTSSAQAINQAGDIVGWSQITGDTQFHAFMYRSGGMRDLGTLGGSESRAFAINDAGQVVGSSFVVGSSDDHAFLYQNGSMVDLYPSGAATAWSINNRGHVVGRLAAPASPTGWHAFRYCGGAATDLNGLLAAGSNAELVDASDINDNGQIVGTAAPSGSSILRAYLLTPL